MTQHAENDDLDRMLATYRSLDADTPPRHLEQRILQHARRQSRWSRLSRTQLVWPLSAAAALVICLGAALQMARHAPAPAQYRLPEMLPAAERLELPPEAPTGRHEDLPLYRAPTEELSGSSAQGGIPLPAEGAGTPSPTLDPLGMSEATGLPLSTQGWLALLDDRRQAEDPEGFVALFKTARQQHPNLELRTEMKDWLQARGLDADRL